MSGLKDQLNQQRSKPAPPPGALAATFTEVKKKRIVVDVPPELHKALKELAAREETPIRELVITALEQQYDL